MLARVEHEPTTPPLSPPADLLAAELGPALMADEACGAAFPLAGPEQAHQYYRARYYDPKIGRFIGEDPIGFGGGVNFYGYVHGNPVNRVDPSGLFAPPIHQLITYRAARELGLSRDVAWDLGAQVSAVDSREGSQDPENSLWHAMSNADATYTADDLRTYVRPIFYSGLLDLLVNQ